MKILFITSEAAPLAKVGGLADVSGSLPRALNSLGHDVRVLMPQYAGIDRQLFPLTAERAGFRVSLPGNTRTVNLNRMQAGNVIFYLLENRDVFGTEEVYTDDLERFFFFSRAAFEILPHLEWQPEIIHCHDWLTALVIMWSKKAGYPYASVFTIHNLAYQGLFDESFMDHRGLRKDWDFFPPDAPRPAYNFMSQAILWADLVTTVSETYAREITSSRLGSGLEAFLRYRAARDELRGIVNGIDYDYWNPQTDEYLPVNFNSNNLKKRVLNKIALQKTAGLPVDSDIPLIGMVQRLDAQKGLDIFEQAVDSILQETGVQFVILGKGWDNYEEMLRQIASRNPRQAAVFIAFEEALAHLIYGGCDMFLMPSQFEPCGLGQMIAMRYGALPIVRHTGGLVDTVPQMSADLSEGNGFVFHEYSGEALFQAVREAVEAYRKRAAWSRAMRRVSQLDFSWQSSARRYESIYRQVLELSSHPL